MELITALNYQDFFTESGFKAFENLHQSAWDLPVQLSTHFEITKRHQKIEDFQSTQTFDIIYFDAFGPRAQEEVWSSEIIDKMYLLLKKDGFLVTYCAKGEIKRRMKNAGFTIEALPGPPGKREMTRAWKR
jgi:tRNA U34 5-methylaminomethyl-2-thiouridine-forming methyltransferase MnmC